MIPEIAIGILAGIAICALFFAILRKLLEKSRAMQLKQVESVYKRALNDSTAAFTKDVTVVNVGGLELQDLSESFPRLFESLEKTRKKNPEAWFRVVQQWLPLIMTKQKTQKAASDAISSIAEGLNNTVAGAGK